ncbi:MULTISPECIES: stage II sporulation protein P [unclassified Sedimentibacter]|uniref:stage II sporulation protein P n=1 Tax=unclassified Sedimentibacter TaxID=2649220 RepID=UPI0027E04F95|nr:stage II sporulation protein P [Sedimentibacter sp. MB35-C1]WMJ76532.1 stage II sporulation protein P [Sedimentibacter sp. MB35-C1]
MKRRRRNKGKTKIYMSMSIFCLTILFIGYSYVYNLSEERKSGKDVTTISIHYNENVENQDDMNFIDKLMSYFNIFLEKTFNESEEQSRLIDSDVLKSEEVLNSSDHNQEQNDIAENELKIYDEEDTEPQLAEKEILLAANRQEDFFRVIESPTYRSSSPRDIFIDAASINENLNVVVFHTHGTEAFLPHKEGNYRTQDERYNVMGVGTKITANLQGYGINAVHLKDYNDYPDYNSSYYNSKNAVSKVLSDNKKNLIIDIHRDGAEENSLYEQTLSQVKTTEINGENAATCTLVIGNYNENYDRLKENAQLLFDKAEEMYPGLFRKIIIRDKAYFNQYLSDYALLVEVGCTLNHIDEVNYSAELLSDVLIEYIEEISK